MKHMRQNAYVRSLCYLIVFAIMAGSFAVVWRSYPKMLDSWSQKGSAADMIGPAILFVGSLAGVFLARYRRMRRLPSSWMWLGYAAFLGFLAMEEIGWGFEFFGFARPVVNGIAVDSVHDLFRLVRRVPIRDLMFLMQLGAGVVVLMGLWVVVTATGRRLLRSISPSIALLLTIAAGALFWAAIFDIRIVDVFWFMRRNPAYELEEGLELLAEVMLVLVVVDGWLSLPVAPKLRSVPTKSARAFGALTGAAGALRNVRATGTRTA